MRWKRAAVGVLGALALAASPWGAGAQDPEKSLDEARRIVIEYRDGTRQTLRLEKEWWEILNILLPTTAAPVRKEPPAPAAPPAAEAPSVRKLPVPIESAPKPVALDVSGRWVNWRQGEKQVHTMSLIQTGKRVRGLHRMDPKYIIDGTLEGNILKGTWSSPEEVGEFIFEFSEDGKTFHGRWNTTGDLTNWHLGWNGRKP